MCGWRNRPAQVGREGRHLRIAMDAGEGRVDRWMPWASGLGHRLASALPRTPLDVVFRVETECYRGVLQPRITLLDFWTDRHERHEGREPAGRLHPPWSD